MAEAVTRTLGGSAAWYGRQSLPVGIPRQSLGTRANEGERGRYESERMFWCSLLLPLASSSPVPVFPSLASCRFSS